MRATIVITIFGLALVVVAFAACRHFHRTITQPSNELSKMVSVRSIVAQALFAHYDERGSFPRSLSELPLQTLNWGDEGSSPKDSEHWHYSSDGQSFTMTWTNSLGQEYFFGARGKEVFHSRDEARR